MACDWIRLIGCLVKQVRRRALERFLNRVAAHAELVACTHFHTFLQADDAGLAKAKEDTKQEKQKKGLAQVGHAKFVVVLVKNENLTRSTRGASCVCSIQWFDNTVTAMSSSAMSREDFRSAADLQVEEEGQYISLLETQLQNVVKHTT